MSPTRSGLATILAAWIAVAATGVVMCGEAPGRGPEPDPRMQSAIEDTVSAIVGHETNASDRVQSLQSLAAGRREYLLWQMALYLENSDGTERSMAGAILFHQLGFTPRQIMNTVVPRLEGARPVLRRVLTEMLGTIDRREGGEPDLRVYDSWLAGHGDRPPAALVAYLYEASPDEALNCMRRVYGRGAQARLEVDDAIDEIKRLTAVRDTSRSWSAEESRRAVAALEILGRDPAWWVRRYVAAVLGSNRELATPALVQRLKEDAEPLVRDGLEPH